MRPETVMIETDNGPVMINKSDFDPNVHKLQNAADMPLPTPPQVQLAGPAAIDANGNPVNAGDGGTFVPPQQTALRTDGPTVAEYVAAGYDPNSYPPAGYESRSTPEEIETAKSEHAAKQPQTPPAGEGGASGENGTPGGTETLLVTKNGRKFVVVNQAGEPVERDGIEKDGYKTEPEAWAAIMALQQQQPQQNA